MSKLNIFILPRIPKKPDSILLQLLLGSQKEVGGLFQKVESKYFTSLVNFVGDVTQADYLMMPHNYFHIKTDTNYIKDVEDAARKYNRKVIVFAYGDSSEDINMTSSIILRTSRYKSTLRSNEIIIPPFVEDLGEKYGIDDESEIMHTVPVVGFAGQASFANWYRYVLYIIKLSVKVVRMSFGLGTISELPGVYFRRYIWHRLKDNCIIHSLFLIRNTFSAHKNTVGDNPSLIRREFAQNIKDSDFSLAIKGDGNYSLRFFEILSLGRMPLLIDTDIVLPLEHIIDYNQVVYRIDVHNLKRLESNIIDWFSHMDKNSMNERRKNARKLFEHFLSPKAFYYFLLTDSKSPLYSGNNLDN